MKNEEIEDVIYYHNYKATKTDVKLEDSKNDDFTEIPEYINDKSLENARMTFRTKSSMVNRT